MEESGGAEPRKLMKMLRIYVRVLHLLGPNAAQAWTVALSNLALAATPVR
jgi:hypothetical protein